MSECPREIANLLEEIIQVPAGEIVRLKAKLAKLDALLSNEVTTSLARLSTGIERATQIVGESFGEVSGELVQTRKQMADSSAAASRHQRALVRWTVVLSFATIAYAVAAFLPLFWRTVSVSGSPERAWVLWVMGENPGTVSYPGWTQLKAFATRKECGDLVKAGFGTYDTRCLPDTLDPRGPKGK